MGNTPNIRFKGYTDDWEQRKLGAVVEDYVKKTTVEDQYPVLTSSQQKGIVLQDDYFSGDRVSQNGNVGYFIIPRGYFAFRSRSDNDVFVFNRNDVADMGIISYFYPVFKPKGVDSDFLLRRLNYGLEDQIKINSEGTGQHVLSLKKFKNMVGLFPSYEEQKKVGSYFSKIDNLISRHQQEYDNMAALKKYMLQKMFPANGEKVPEIRFEGFTGDWEQRKLDDVTVKIGSGKTPSGGENAYVDAGIPLIRSQNVNDNKVDFEDIVYIDESTDKLMMNSRVFANDVLLNITGASIGRSAVYKGLDEANVNQHVCIIRPIEGYHPDFIQLNLASDRGQKQIKSSQAGGGREGLNFQQIGKMEFVFPTLDEQKQIGNYFNNIDHLITLHQREYEKLQELKKFMLQNMFV